MTFFLGLSALVVLWLGSREVILGRMTLGEFVAFNSYLGMLSWPMIAFGWVTNLLQRGTASWKRLLEILDTPPAIQDAPGAKPASAWGPLRGDIEFRDLTFAYAADAPPVLEHVSLAIAAGQTVAIMGATGSGKSSLIGLLPRLHDPPPGTVFIDGVDVRDIPLSVLRGAIGMVPQEPFLFSETVAENIAFGAPRACGPGVRTRRRGQPPNVEAEGLDAVLAAAEIARLDKDVDAFPQAWETMVGERGLTLSGGQKQRTALARALLIDPPILILDDALSAVDTYTEEEILSRLRGVMRQRTSIIVAHRVSTVRQRRSDRRPRSRPHRRARHARRAGARGWPLCGNESEAAPGGGAGRELSQVSRKLVDRHVTRRGSPREGVRQPLDEAAAGIPLAVHATTPRAALLAIFLNAALQLAQPYLIKVAIDDYIAKGDLGGVSRIAAWFFLVLVAGFALEYVQTWLMQMTGQRIMFDMRMQIYGHLQRLDLRDYDRNPVGRLMTRVTSDIDVLNELFSSGIVAAFGDVFMLAGIMIVLVRMDWRLALIAFSVLPLIVLVTQWFRVHVRESYRTVRTLIARINAFLQENITGMATVQLFRREARQLRALRRHRPRSTATRTSSRFSTTRCSIRRSSWSARWRRR